MLTKIAELSRQSPSLHLDMLHICKSNKHIRPIMDYKIIFGQIGEGTNKIVIDKI